MNNWRSIFILHKIAGTGRLTKMSSEKSKVTSASFTRPLIYEINERKLNAAL